MQQTQNTIYKKCLIGLSGAVWVVGLLIAGSDSPYMPWVNGIGLILFFSANIFLSKLLRPNQSNASIILYPKFYQKPYAGRIALKKRSHRIINRCALGI
ncbi:MAG: hypothetical protein GY699_14685 [Desulfobacteraceae bacterium]|nr:hypothetical protein [Desulfobacteraceae bacterium]